MDVVWTERKCLALGALAALGWFATDSLDLLTQAQPPYLPPLPLVVRLIIRIALVLSFPVLVLLLDRAVWKALRRHWIFTLAVVLPAVLVTALPALIPITSLQHPEDVLLSAMLLPTASLGLALGVTDGSRGLRRPHPRADGLSEGFSPGVIAGIGFWLVLVLAAIIVLVLGSVTAGCVNSRYGCHPLVASIFLYGTCGLVLGWGVASLIGGSLGYAIGWRLPRLTRRTPAPSAQ